ncbi:hypothetical protein C4559_06340 [Candidatus Microgenomates bacterium]|nr:MAG: hypothetical protein C4559_06340 [Candidatus Microgenomates bacterium]
MVKAKINPIVILSALVIIVSTFFASWFAIHGDIVFHTDIARDFLLMEDVVRVKPLTLIGPRSGGIPGVFHGPAWTYFNVPAFIIGNGSPAVVGWFWVLLYLAGAYISYYVGSKMFSKNVGWVAAAITSAMSAFSVPSFFNPYGAVMLTPLFIYLIFKYIKSSKLFDLLLCLLTLGFVIQFQMAFGVPLLVLLLPLLIFVLFKNKKYSHIFALLILLIPLSTFILFDLKHQFLQTKSVMNYISGKENIGKVEGSFSNTFKTRIDSMLSIGPNFLAQENMLVRNILLLIFLIAFYQTLRNKELKNYKLFYFLFLYFYVGYWLMTVFYKGVMWSYYYWPFLGLIALVAATFGKLIDKKIIYPILIALIVFNLYIGYKNGFKPASYFGSDNSSWRFNESAADLIYRDAPSEFGYYIFTADQYGYPSRYAMNFVQTNYKNKKAFPYEKKAVTYLLIYPSNNPTISDGWWKNNKVKIDQKPEKVFTFKNSNFRIEKYVLSPEVVNDKSDDTLIHDLIFR